MEIFALFFPFLFIWPILMALFAITLAFGAFAFSIWMIVDCYKRDFKDRDMWLIILLVGLFLGYGLIASIVYFFVVKSQMK